MTNPSTAGVTPGERPDVARRALQTYSDAWAERDAARRRALFAEALSPDFVYTDPLTQTAGFEGLGAYMAGLQEQTPGVRFVLTDVQTHHDRLMTRWDMLDGGGQVLSKGASYGVHAADGRLTQMTGFFGA